MLSQRSPIGLTSINRRASPATTPITSSLLPLPPSPFLASLRPRFVSYGREYQPSTIKRKRRHGFLKRLRTLGGRMILKRRMLKGRKNLSY
ncbi:ribosomal protein L34-domain-containing protein [Fimicolochytrium jonesii]|uniref:ribosomal protein L34-domain-containing protein n=1 Tax=Fimicolochytrium jonesii TaxID=1396493 RepID=UPI0022FEE581|nr:ribosomal protein L34-domain-containing protein [Fimicolochytrium jonesii]KAI8821796.1 ribosomal protein L34-domain-containing protein [Fimicolochytrium jonesii]